MQYSFKLLPNKVALLFLFILISGNLLSISKSKHRKVLLIHSYNYGFPTASNMIKGVHAVFDTCDIKVDIEFMDWKRLPLEVNKASFFNALQIKLNNTKPYDAIITSDDAALHFAIDHQEELFKNIPIVFAGVNNNQLAFQQNKNKWITGIAESISMQENIELIKNLFPATKKIYCIADSTLTGQSDLHQFKSYMNKEKDTAYEIINLGQLSFKEFTQSIKNIPGNNPVLLISAYADKDNQNKEFEDSFSTIKKNLDAPLFHLYYHGMGDGVIGGKLVSHYELGRSAAILVKRIFDGVRAQNLPVVMESPNKYIFDYRELIRFNVDFARLPKQATLIHQPKTFYEINKKVIFFIVIFLAFQGLFIVYLIQANARRKKAEQKMQQKTDEYYRLNEEYAALNEELLASIEEVERKNKDLEYSEELYRVTLDAANDGYWDWDLTNNQVFFSSRWKEILGYEDYELKNEFDTWKDNVHEDDVNEALLKVENYIAGKDDRYEVEFRMRHKQGYYVHILAKGLLMRDDEGRVYRIIGTHQDLTERYKHEHNLKEQVEENLSLYEEYRTISDELFVKNNDLLATEEELRANNEELYLKNEEIAQSEEKYRMLFENMTEAFALHEIVLDEDNKPVDYIFRDVNPLFLKRLNMTAEQVVNKSALSLFPDTEKVWIETFGEVALTGEPKFIKDYSKELDHYYETTIFSPKTNFFAAVFKDVTDETRANLRLQESLEQLKVKEKLLQDMFNSSPVVMMILNKQANIVDINQTGQSLIKETTANIDQEQPGNMLSCINSFLHPKGCGHSKLCTTCVLRNSITETVNLKEPVHKKEFELLREVENGREEKSNWLVSTSPLFDSDEEKILVCLEDVSTLKEKELQLVKRNNEMNQVNKRFEGLENIISYKAHSIPDLLDHTLNNVISYTDSDFGAVYHYDKSKQIFYLNNYSDAVSLTLDAFVENNKINCLGKAVKTKKPVILNEEGNSYSFLNKKNQQNIKSLTIPILVNNDVTAVFWVANHKHDYHSFHAKQVMLLLETTWIIVEKQKLQEESRDNII